MKRQIAFYVVVLVCLISCMSWASQNANMPAEHIDTLLGTQVPNRSQTIQNLRAFAKLYGYVKYFHPSDEASSTDWDVFAVYGTGQVKKAKDSKELKETLETLFLPIAPTIQIYGRNQKPRDYSESLPKNTAGLKVTAWQHLGVGSDESDSYKSIRLNSETRYPREYSGSVWHTVSSEDIERCRGRKIKLKAAVRTSLDNPESWGILIIMVRTASGKRLDYRMENRLTGVTPWTVHELEGSVTDDARQVNVGLILSGKGRIWADEMEISIVNNSGEWQSVEIGNAGFEQTDNSVYPTKWWPWGVWHKYRIDETRPYRGKRCLLLESDDSSQKLFEEYPTVVETVTKPLDSGLLCQIPLALYSDEQGTLGNNDRYPYSILSDQLEEMDTNEFTADEEDVRLADVIITWNVFQHFYPYFDIVDVNWDSELTYTLQEALSDRNQEDFWYTLSRLVAALQDGHAGRALGKPPSSKASLPLRVDWIENRVVVIASAESSEVRPGDIIVSIDGVKAEDVLSHYEQYISGSPQWKRYRVLSSGLFGSGEPGTKVTLIVKRVDKTFEMKIERNRPGMAIRLSKPESRTPISSIEEIQEGIYYVNLLKVGAKEIDETIDILAKARGVVFDFRGYPRIDITRIICHLLREKDSSDAWMRTPKIIYPDFENVNYEKEGWGLQPKEPHIEGKVVFLTNAGALSAAESYLSFVEHYKLGVIVGQPTAGVNGDVNRFTLPGKYQIDWTGLKVVKHDGSQHHVIGIQPTVPVERTIQGVITGRDEFLEKALEIIHQR